MSCRQSRKTTRPRAGTVPAFFRESHHRGRRRGGYEKVGKMMRSAKAKGRVWQATCLNLDRMCFNVVLVISCARKVERIRTRSASRLEGRTGGLQSSIVSCSVPVLSGSRRFGLPSFPSDRNSPALSIFPPWPRKL